MWQLCVWGFAWSWSQKQLGWVPVMITTSSRLGEFCCRGSSEFLGQLMTLSLVKKQINKQTDVVIRSHVTKYFTKYISLFDMVLVRHVRSSEVFTSVSMSVPVCANAWAAFPSVCTHSICSTGMRVDCAAFLPQLPWSCLSLPSTKAPFIFSH